MANATSSRSLSVIDGADTCTPGRFIPLWLLSSATVQHARRDARPFDVEHDQFEQAVVDQDAVAIAARRRPSRSYVTGIVARAARCPPGTSTTFGAVGAARNGCARSPMRMRGPCRSPRMAIGPVHLVGHAAHARDRLRVLLVRAVREVDAGHVQPRVDETAKGLGRGGGGAERADDLGAAESLRERRRARHGAVFLNGRPGSGRAAAISWPARR